MMTSWTVADFDRLREFERVEDREIGFR